jgi:thioredoxin reductase (NADPH)
MIQVYGTDWCRLTFAIRQYLMQSRVEYDYFDIDSDQQADGFVRTMNDGRRRFPMVVIDERIVTNPTLTELRRILQDNRVESRSAPRERTQRIVVRVRSRRG